jgi:glycosyltransferase involved in cell wall biosynthesis
MTFIFWQRFPSPHLSFFLNELGKVHKVILIVEEHFDEEKLRQGWENHNSDNFKIIKLDTLDNFCFLDNEKINIRHIFSGIFSSRLLFLKFLNIIRKERVSIISESPNSTGFKGVLRRLLYVGYYILFNESIDKIFVIGSLAAKWYRSVGFPNKKLIYFNYTISQQFYPSYKTAMKKSGRISFYFVGQFITRKNVLFLVKLFVGLRRYQNWELSLVGDGPLKNKIQNIVIKKNLNHQVQFKGVIQNSDLISNLISNCDYLILPSKFDGWGSVVSESVASGVKVITNYNVGASDVLLDFPECGFIYQNRQHLVDKLVELISGNKNNEDKIALDTQIRFWNKYQLSVVDNFVKAYY